ncbi:MAG: glycine betaine ABC transporter substrate-binding protein, partial [Anaerolineae bacterium]
MNRLIRILLLLLVLMLMPVLNGCRQAPLGYVRVGSTSDGFTTIAAKLLIYALDSAGYQAEDATGYATAVALRSDMTAGTVDLSWFNTAETWHKLLGHDQPLDGLEVLAETIAAEDLAKGFKWKSPAPYNLIPGLVMRTADLAGKRMNKISELAPFLEHYGPLTLCAPAELHDTTSQLVRFQLAYKLKIPTERIFTYSSQAGLSALSSGECNCALAYEIDMSGKANFTFLQDDKHMLTATGYALAVRQELISEYPDIEYILE